MDSEKLLGEKEMNNLVSSTYKWWSTENALMRELNGVCSVDDVQKSPKNWTLRNTTAEWSGLELCFWCLKWEGARREIEFNRTSVHSQCPRHCVQWRSYHKLYENCARSRDLRTLGLWVHRRPLEVVYHTSSRLEVLLCQFKPPYPIMILPLILHFQLSLLPLKHQCHYFSIPIPPLFQNPMSLFLYLQCNHQKSLVPHSLLVTPLWFLKSLSSPFLKKPNLYKETVSNFIPFRVFPW